MEPKRITNFATLNRVVNTKTNMIQMGQIVLNVWFENESRPKFVLLSNRLFLLSNRLCVSFYFICLHGLNIVVRFNVVPIYQFVKCRFFVFLPDFCISGSKFLKLYPM